jgi:YD repeat-containing protein
VRTTYTWYYPKNTSTDYIVNLPARTQLWRLRNGAQGASVVGETQLFYDQTSDYTTAPTDGELRLQKVKLSTGVWAETEYDYTAEGNLQTVIDPLDNETEIYYDSYYKAFAVCQENDLGYETKTRYYGVPGSETAGCSTSDGSGVWSGGSPVSGRFFGQVEDVTDPNGAITSYEYDWWGRATGIWRPGEAKASSHDATELIDYTDYVEASQTPFKIHHQQRNDVGGSNSPTDYLDSWTFMDGLGRVVQTQADAASASQIVVANSRYDGQDRVLTDTLPYLKTATGGTYQTPDWTESSREYTYDRLGRLTEAENPDGTTVRSYYNNTSAGLLTAVIDAEDHMTIHVVDGLGRLVGARQFSGTYASNPTWTATPYATAAYDYDVADRLTEVTDPGDDSTTIAYDDGGRKTSMDDMDMGQWYYKYDAAGNLLTQVDARSNAICFYYR